MEARVKERLTGAVVLVAIIIIVVPELLSGPKRSAAPPPGSHTVKIDLTGPHRVAPASAASAVPTPPSGTVMSVRPDGPSVPVSGEPAATDANPVADTTPVADTPPAARTPPPGAGKPPPDAAATHDAPPPAAAAAAMTPAVPAPAATHPPPATPAASHPAPAAAAAATAPATASAAAAATQATSGAAPAAVSGWVVQLGSFASRENAQKLVQELHHKGYSAFLAEYRGNGRVLFRVRVGPEQDRARADALRLRLGHEGYTGSVTPHP